MQAILAISQAAIQFQAARQHCVTVTNIELRPIVVIVPLATPPKVGNFLPKLEAGLGESWKRMTWNIRRTLDLVEAKFGRPQREVANRSIQSTDQRLRYARFHYHQGADDLTSYRADKLGDRLVLDVAYSNDESEQQEYLELMERLGAHAVACVQSIHAVADLLTASVFVSLNLSAAGTPVAEHDITYGITLKRLAADPKNAKLEALLKKLNNDSGFRHVDALSNKAKHSSIVRPMLNDDFTGLRAERVELHFEEFERKGVTYPSGSIAGVLGPGFNLASQTVVDVGIELISVLT